MSAEMYPGFESLLFLDCFLYKRKTMTITRPAIDRIFEKVIKQKEGCWIFVGHRTYFGYGTIKIGGKNGKPRQVHREIYRHFKGVIPEGMFVCHKCDNPPCCNPDHLF